MREIHAFYINIHKLLRRFQEITLDNTCRSSKAPGILEFSVFCYQKSGKIHYELIKLPYV